MVEDAVDEVKCVGVDDDLIKVEDVVHDLPADGGVPFHNFVVEEVVVEPPLSSM